MNNFKNNTILIIDDDTWIQKVLKKILNKIEIEQVYSALNGFDGINLALEKKPSMVFLDLFMPELDGYNILKLFKTIDLLRNIPVIVITANSDFLSIGKVISLGAAEFIVKPFTFATVLEKVNKVLENVNKQPQHNEIDSVGFDYSQLDESEKEFFTKFDITSGNHVVNETKITKSVINPKFTTSKEKYDKNINYTDKINKLLEY